MKKFFFGAFCFTLTLVVQAQLKIFSGGNVAIGQLNGSFDTKFKVVGNSSFNLNDGYIHSSAMIRGNNTFSGSQNPDYTFYNNDNTGLFHPSVNQLGFCTNGKAWMYLTDEGNLCLDTTLNNNSAEKLVINAGDRRAIFLDVKQNKDWWQSMTTKVSRAYTVNYVVNWNNRDRFYVRGDGMIFSMMGIYVPTNNLSPTSKPITDAVNRLSQIGTFTGINENRSFFGLNTPDVQQAVPEALDKQADGSSLINYDVFVPLLIEAIKTQQKQLINLQAALDKLKNPLGNSLVSNNPIGSITTNSEVASKEYNTTDISNQLAPGENWLEQNQPNPFDKETTIRYHLPSGTTQAALLIFDLQGTLKTNYTINTENTNGAVKIQANSLPAGMYLFTLLVNGRELSTRRMIINH